MKSEPVDPIVAKLDELAKQLSRLAVTGPSSSQPVYQAGPTCFRPSNVPSQPPFTCHYCGQPGHTIGNCHGAPPELATLWYRKDDWTY